MGNAAPGNMFRCFPPSLSTCTIISIATVLFYILIATSHNFQPAPSTTRDPQHFPPFFSKLSPQNTSDTVTDRPVSVPLPEHEMPDTNNKRLPATCEDDPTSAFTRSGDACVNVKRLSQIENIFFANGSDSRYVYCSIPKNGCTYHLGVMVRVMGSDSWQKPRDVHPPEARAKILLREDAFANVMLDEGIPKYVVVRNPMTRTLSGYLNKVQYFLPERLHTVEHFTDWVYEQFPKNVKEGHDWTGINPHWTPQVNFCGFQYKDLWSYFTVFRVEDPKSYVDYIYKIVDKKHLVGGWGSEGDKSFSDHVLGPRERSENTTAKFYKYFEDVSVFDHVAQALKEDINRLGYKNEIAEMRRRIVEGRRRRRR